MLNQLNAQIKANLNFIGVPSCSLKTTQIIGKIVGNFVGI